MTATLSRRAVVTLIGTLAATPFLARLALAGGHRPVLIGRKRILSSASTLRFLVPAGAGTQFLLKTDASGFWIADIEVEGPGGTCQRLSYRRRLLPGRPQQVRFASPVPPARSSVQIAYSYLPFTREKAAIELWSAEG